MPNGLLCFQVINSLIPGLQNAFLIVLLLERALEECGDDLDSAIRSLNELRLSSAANESGAASEASRQPHAQGQALPWNSVDCSCWKGCLFEASFFWLAFGHCLVEFFLTEREIVFTFRYQVVPFDQCTCSLLCLVYLCCRF